MFAENLDEFDSSRWVDCSFDYPLPHRPGRLLILGNAFVHVYIREVVQELIGEYEACESPDYLSWSPVS